MNVEFIEALRNLEKEKGIPFPSLLDGLRSAFEAAYKKSFPPDKGARVEVHPESGEVMVFQYDLDEEGMPVRDDAGNLVNEIPIEKPKDFGRIEAQTAKQVILQKIREAEREMTFGEYEGRAGDIVSGIVQQSDGRVTHVDLGRGVEATLPVQEQVPGERYEHNGRIRAYIVDVKKTSRGPQIILSRSHPNLVRRLFDMEVPEIEEGIVEIRGIAREAGHRTKLAVVSNEPGVDAIGACVGPKGSRVRMVVNELHGEKIDIVPFSEDPSEYVANALSPAKVKEVRIDHEARTALVIVPDYQLSLAIGKEGQNARLAARLTGWRVDIKSESQVAGEPEAEAASGGEPVAQ
ncbi:MAG: transcription termination factor NusA [Actinomycetota bacterium]|nr:transcription termination factor NusA [Actinomycetota bacterium]